MTKKPNDPRWVVYHCDEVYNRFSDKPKPRFPEDYTKVAIVACRSLDDLYCLTNHRDRAWTRNPEVMWHVGRLRSTSIGDIVVDEDLGIWWCDSVGWKKLDK